MNESMLGITISLAALLVLLTINWFFIKQREKTEQFAELYLTGRAVGITLQNVVNALKNDDWTNTTHHLAVARMRHERIQPTANTKDAHALLSVVISYIESCIESAKVEDWESAGESLEKSIAAYTLFIGYVKTMAKDMP